MTDKLVQFPGITITPVKKGGWVVRHRTGIVDTRTRRPICKEQYADNQMSLIAIILNITNQMRQRGEVVA